MSARKILRSEATFEPCWLVLRDGTTVWTKADATVLVDWASNKITKKLTGAAGHWRSSAAASDGRYLAFETHQNTLTIWDVQTPTEPTTVKANGNILKIGIAQDGMVLAIVWRDNAQFLQRWSLLAGE